MTQGGERTNRVFTRGVTLVAVVWLALMLGGVAIALSQESAPQKLVGVLAVLFILGLPPFALFRAVMAQRTASPDVEPIDLTTATLTAEEAAGASRAEQRIKELLTSHGVTWEYLGLGATPRQAAVRVYEWQGEWTLTADEQSELRDLCPLVRFYGVQVIVDGAFEFYEYSPFYSR